MKTIEIDAKPLFDLAGVEMPLDSVCIGEMSKVTYEFQQENLKANWSYATFRAFVELRNRLGSAVDHVFLHAVGNGVEAIAAQYLFEPEYLSVSDINADALKIAVENIIANDIELSIAESSDLFQNSELVRFLESQRPSIAFANLPTIPKSGVDTQTEDAASYYEEKYNQDCPELLQHLGLGLNYHFLRQVGAFQDSGDSAVIALGGRWSWEYVEQLFREAGYANVEQLFSMVKVQTQPEDVIPGYAELNRKYDIGAFFIALQKVDPEQFESSGNLGVSFEKSLTHAKITAEIAEKQIGKQEFGHILYVVRGIKS